MAKKAFDYSKWDKIELSDDEEDVHPNIDRESWFRLKHRSRVEREENEEKDKKRILKEMEEANQRIKVLQHELDKLKRSAVKKDDEDDDDDDDDLDDREGVEAEISELQQQNAARQLKLDEYEKNKKWNVDNMFHVKEERTVVNPDASKPGYTETGFAKPKEDDLPPPSSALGAESQNTSEPVDCATQTTTTATATTVASKTASAPTAAKPISKTSPTPSSSGPAPAKQEYSVIDSYPEFTEKYADTIELFMQIPDLEGSKEFLLKYGDILLQENASNYLLLASLEDEMNGHHEKMKRTARQSQIITNIAELAKTLKTHPGNVIVPFFGRLQQREALEEFLLGVQAFVDKIVARAVVKRREMDEARREKEKASDGSGTDLSEIPREERLGPGGLDPLEVIETLPDDMVKAFESRDVEQLKIALSKLEPAEAEYHMKRCVDSGLWVANSS